MNIERGLFWNQENAISRGVQISDTFKKLTLTASWNDGFYSDLWNWITGSASFAFNSSNTLAFVGGGNAGRTSTAILQLRLHRRTSQSTTCSIPIAMELGRSLPIGSTPRASNAAIGLPQSGSTDGGALLLNYNFKDGLSLRHGPNISSAAVVGTPQPRALNLLYGPGSSAFGFTVTPTYQKGGFFLRGDLGIADTPGFHQPAMLSATWAQMARRSGASSSRDSCSEAPKVGMIQRA